MKPREIQHIIDLMNASWDHDELRVRDALVGLIVENEGPEFAARVIQEVNMSSQARH